MGEAYDSGELLPFQVQSTGISNFKWTDFINRTNRAVPPRPVQEHFRRAVGPMLSAIGVLGLQTSKLRQTRNLLLPRLMSGQLRLADIEAAPAARV
jgi:type I restriction enzyme S subunit